MPEGVSRRGSQEAHSVSVGLLVSQILLWTLVWLQSQLRMEGKPLLGFSDV